MLTKNFVLVVITLITCANSIAENYKRLTSKMPSKKMQKILPSPESWKVLPSSKERKAGWIAFQRPMLEPVFPQTKPRPGERINSICAFAARDEYETLTFTIYPLRDLKGLKISVSDLKMGSKDIDSSDILIRLATYRYILYPRYVSNKSCMRMPEFLEPVNSNNAAKAEAQRYYITIKPPANTPAGLYQGNVTIKCGEEQQSLRIKFRVLPFELIQDPNKKYSVMYGSGSPLLSLGRGKSAKWIEHALQSDFKNMRNYGLNTLPSFWLSYNPKNLSWDFSAKVKKAIRMAQDNGFKAPLLIVGCPFGLLYKEAVGERLKSHCIPPKPVPESVYLKFDKIVAGFAKKAKNGNYPEMIFCPLDEIAPQQNSMELGRRVYEIFKKYGFKTYATKDPESTKAEIISPYVDFWCSQAFSKTYNEVVSDKKHGYWSYPNLNTYELKDPLIMCKGGRMTFGFGFWRSGYSMIYPYIWRSANTDHLKNGSAGGNFLDSNGNVIMTTYWECFREGIDDAKYIYTLQNAIVQRDGSNNKELYKLVAKGKRLLQDIWDSINVQPQYLKKGIWASAEFNARRWQMAEMITELYKYQPLNKQVASSVIVNTDKQTHKDQKNKRTNKESGNNYIESFSLADKNFSQWHYGREGVVGSIQKNPKGILRLKMTMDSKNGIGWPRIARKFQNEGIDISNYDFFSVHVRINSNRDEVKDDVTPLSLVVSSKNKISSGTKILTNAQQNKWLHILCPLSSILQKLPSQEQKNISTMLICTREGDYPDGTELILEFKKPELIKYKQAMITETEIPRIIYSGNNSIKFKIKVVGESHKNCKVKSVLSGLNNRVITSCVHNNISSGSTMLDMPIKRIKPGQYIFKVKICRKGKAKEIIHKQLVNIIKSPFN